MTRRILAFAFGLAALSALVPEVQAQIKPGLHLARAADSFDGGEMEWAEASR
jgi:hypothetical protein